MNDNESSAESDTIPEHPVKSDHPFEAIGRDACPTGLGQLDLQMWEDPALCVPCASHSAAVRIKTGGTVSFAPVWPLSLAVSVLRALLLPLATTLMGS